MTDAKERISPVDEIRLLRAAARDWRFSRGDLGTFAVLLRHCDNERRAFPGPNLIAREANLAPTNVKRSLRKLEQLMYLRVERPGLRRSNRYVVLESPSVPTRPSGSSKMEKLLGETRQRSNRVDIPSKEGGNPPAPTATRYEHVVRTGYANGKELGTSTRQEVALNELFNSQRAFSQRENLTPERERRLTEMAREAYLAAKEGGNASLMATYESIHRERIEDLIGSAK